MELATYAIIFVAVAFALSLIYVAKEFTTIEN